MTDLKRELLLKLDPKTGEQRLEIEESDLPMLAKAMAMAQAPAGPGKLLKLAEVEARVGLKKSAIYQRVAAGTFPAPVSIAAKASRWRESDVEKWLQDVAGPSPKL